MKRSTLFTILMFALAISIVVTSIGLLANWGIITSAVVERGKSLPLLWPMVSGVILASVGVILEVARKRFVEQGGEPGDTYLELLGHAVITPANRRDEANSNFREISDYLEDYCLKDDIELKQSVKQKMELAAGKAIRNKFGGEQKAESVPEVLSRFIK